MWEGLRVCKLWLLLLLLESVVVVVVVVVWVYGIYVLGRVGLRRYLFIYLV